MGHIGAVQKFVSDVWIIAARVMVMIRETR